MQMREKNFMKSHSLAYFAVIIGTGGLGHILYQISLLKYWPGLCWLKLPAGLLAGLADLLYIGIFLPWLIRWLLYYRQLRQDLHNPVLFNFAALFLATLILGKNIHLIWSSSWLGSSRAYGLLPAVWFMILVGSIFFTLAVVSQMLRQSATALAENLNMFWFMAPLANLAALLVGNPVLEISLQFYPDWVQGILLINLTQAGSGLTLFLLINTLVLKQLIAGALSSIERLFYGGVSLAVVGLAVCIILDTAENVRRMGLIENEYGGALLACMIWGFGFWLITVLVFGLRGLCRSGMPLRLELGMIVFALYAYTLASVRIAAFLVSPLTAAATGLLMLFLVVLWLYTLERMFRRFTTADNEV